MPSLQKWLEEKPFTLALSSAFFGFYAHCGVATALYERDLKPAKVTGCSAGALVAGALASGIAPRELKEILFSLKKADFWDPAPGLGFLRGEKFLRLLERHFAKSFDQASLSLEVAAFDLFSLKTKFLREGSLPRSVAASCAVPFLFHPVRIGSRFYVDGGVTQKSGIAPSEKSGRTLCVYLEGPYSSRNEMLKSLKSLGEAQKIWRFQELPAVHYDRLSQGQEAYLMAYQRASEALSAPVKKEMKG